MACHLDGVSTAARARGEVWPVACGLAQMHTNMNAILYYVTVIAN